MFTIIFQGISKACDKPQNSLGGSRYSFLVRLNTASFDMPVPWFEVVDELAFVK